MTHAWRLTFAYDGETFTLKSTRRLVKRVPAGTAPGADTAGRFVELRGPERKVMYRRRITHITPDTIEFPTGDAEQPFGRGRPRKYREVSLLVPALDQARSVAIVSAGKAPMDAERKQDDSAGSGGSRDLISVDLPRDEQPRDDRPGEVGS
jgi:hypothetical protein